MPCFCCVVSGGKLHVTSAEKLLEIEIINQRKCPKISIESRSNMIFHQTRSKFSKRPKSKLSENKPWYDQKSPKISSTALIRMIMKGVAFVENSS